MNREERRRQNKLKKSNTSASPTQMSGDALALYEKATALFEKGDLEGADELCQDAAAGAPLDAEPFHLRALIQYRLGNLNVAGDMILEAITRNDDDPEIHSNCGVIMNMLGRHMEAEAACRHVIELAPHRAEVHSNLGVALEMQGRFDEAIEACEQALKIQPNYPEARINLGNLYVRSADLISAVEAYVKVIEQSPDNPTARANMSVVLLRLNEPEAAVSFALDALEINPDYPEALIALANAYQAQKQYDLALTSFDKALAVHPQSVEARMKRAETLHQSGHSDQAINAFNELIVDNNTAGEVFCGLGTVLQSLGLMDKAIVAFRRAIEIKPSLGIAHYKLVCALGVSVDGVDLKRIQTALDNPKTPLLDKIDLHFSRGEALHSLQEFDRAFIAISSGNELKNTYAQANEMAFDADVFDEHIDAIINVFSDPSKKAQLPQSSATTVPIFIVGMPHSGLSDVGKIIAAHPEVKNLGEAETMIKWVGHEPDDIEGLIEVWGSISAEVEKVYSAPTETPRVLDTTPAHFMYVGIIERLFPNARIIHCQSNVADVELACYFENKTNSNIWSSDLTCIRRYMKAEDRMMTHWKSASQLPILDVDFDRLVSDVIATSKEIIEFIGLDWNDACSGIGVGPARYAEDYEEHLKTLAGD